MRTTPLAYLRNLSAVATLSAAFTLTICAPAARAEATATAPSIQNGPRITQKIDDSRRTVLKGNTLPATRHAADQGAVDPSTPANRMLLVLKRSPAQETALKQAIADMHNPGSPSYHKWLKPAEFGQRFGVAPSDVAAINKWLTAKGFSINKVNQGGNVIDFNGTAGQLAATFHTELHTYVRNGVTFHANNKDPEIPTALADVVVGFASLNDIRPKSDMAIKGRVEYDPKTNTGKPSWTYPDGSGGVSLVPAPADMAVQYNIPSTATGAGETIGIISASNIDVSIVQNYRTLFSIGSATNLPNIIVDGVDPGQNGAATEAYLDVEASGSMAPQATVDMYVGADTNTTSGLEAALVRAVDDDIVDTISLSYGSCEASLGTSGNQFFYYVWQQAAAQGESVFVSAGDGGVAGCDNFDSENQAVDGLAISGFASTPYNTAVGGTDFYYSYYGEGPTGSDLNTQIASYWNLTATNSPAVSIKTVIPEQPWNNSLGLNIQGNGYGIVAGSGGASSCIDDACDMGYAKPSWQTGTGVPADGVRDIPDVSLFAANGVNFSYWPVCLYGTDCNATYSGGTPVYLSGVGGTSASSPATAGIMALIDQQQKGRQGLANYYFYAIAAHDSTAFNDVTSGNNDVSCENGSPQCVYDSATGGYDYGVYAAGTGYDLASGLGTPNVGKILADWKNLTFKSTTTTLAVSPATAVHGVALTATSTVTGSGGTPSGTVGLVTSDSNPNQKGQEGLALASGTATGSVYPPGGTNSITAEYFGDGTFAPSTSSAVSVTITPESSTTTLLGYYQDNNYNYTQVTNGGTYAFGDEYAIDADIVGASRIGAPSGAVTFYDGTTSLGAFQTNTAGVAELNYSNFAPGPHSVTAKYPGDPSFNASTSAALTFTVTQGTPEIYLDDSYDQQGIAPVTGQSFTVPVYVQGNYVAGGETLTQPAAPTGNVVVSFGMQSFTLPLSTVGYYGGQDGLATATFTGFGAGSQTLTVTYEGDPNYTSGTVTSTIPVSAPVGAASVTTLTDSIPGGTLTANGGFNLTATVAPASGTSPVPTGTVTFFVNGSYLYSNDVANGVLALQAVPTSYLETGTNLITANYSGDSIYAPSVSSAVTIVANVGDFALAASTGTVALSASSSATATLSVSSLQGLTGTVALTCTSANTAITCGLSPSSLTLTADGATYNSTLTITTSSSAAATPAGKIRPWLLGSGSVLAFVLLGFPARRRSKWATRGGVLFAMLLMLGLSLGLSGCGSTPSTRTTTPSGGSYPVIVTATDSGIVHTAVINVTIQ